MQYNLLDLLFYDALFLQKKNDLKLIRLISSKSAIPGEIKLCRPFDHERSKCSIKPLSIRKDVFQTVVNKEDRGRK